MIKVDRRAYFRDGFFLPPTIIAVSDEVRRECSRLYRRSRQLNSHTFLNGSKYCVSVSKEGRSVCSRVEWIRYECPAIFQLISSETVLRAVRRLTQCQLLDVIISQVNFREKHDTIEYGWHRDLQSDKGDFKRPSLLNKTIIVFLALTAVAEDQSPIEVIPRSHHDSSTVPRELGNKAADAVRITLKAGQLLFMHPALLHSSSCHTSSVKRFLAIAAFCPKGGYTRTRSDFSIASV